MSSLQEAFDLLDNHGFKTDILINNAGLIHSEPLVNILAKESRVHSLHNWHKVIAANLHSVFNVTGLVVDRMVALRKKGVLINISSVSAKGNPGQSAYSAAKAGVNALTRTWAKELGSIGLRFVAIAPGFLDTSSTRHALSEPILAKLKQQIPLHRFGQVEHVYQTVRFIIENDYVNGTVIDVDGGLVI
jgi:3-oxoacyl-[acyl-carrier protein] reductase